MKKGGHLSFFFFAKDDFLILKENMKMGTSALKLQDLRVSS